MDRKSFLTSALKTTIEAALSTALPLETTWEVVFGWDQPATNDSEVYITIESGDEETVPFNTKLDSASKRDGEMRCDAVLEFANVIVPITLNVYINSETQGLTLRTETLAAISSLFYPTAPGLPPGLVLTLGDSEGTESRTDLISTTHIEGADASSGSTWRTIIKLSGEYRDRHTVDLPYCETISLATAEGTFSPVDSINGE